MKTIILHTLNSEEAIEEMKSNGVHVTQICTQSILLANFPDDFDASSLNHSAVAIPTNLDDMSKLYVDAWNSILPREEATYLKWDEEGYQQPKNAFNDEELAEQARMFPSTTSSYMTGRIAVGLILVGSTKEISQGLFSFTRPETLLAISQVLDGLQALASFEPLAKITFVHATSIYSLNVQPRYVCTNHEQCEAYWRDPVLHLLGVSPGLPGVDQYNQKLTAALNTKWAFTAFITKYLLFHFAYASGGRLCMSYANDHWGPGNIGAVFAHETSHIFGAADEYKSSPCTCANSGYFNVPNFNCVHCTTSIFPKVPCLMDGMTLGNVCAWSRGQVGWNFDVKLFATTSATPSLAYFNNRFFMIIKSNDDYNNIFIASSGDGFHWPKTFTKLVAPTGSSLALAVFKGKLFMFQKGANAAHILYVASSGDGVTWPDKFTSIVSTSGAAPSVAVFKGKNDQHEKLYMAIQSNTPANNSIYIASSDDGVTWPYPFQKLVATTGTSPSLAVFKGKLFMAVQSSSSGNNIQIASSDDGVTWPDTFTQLVSTTGSAPSLAVLKDKHGNDEKLYMAIQSNSIYNHIYIASSDDGVTWPYPFTELIHRTKAPPSLAFIQTKDRLYLSYKRMDDSVNIVNFLNSNAV